MYFKSTGSLNFQCMWCLEPNLVSYKTYENAKVPFSSRPQKAKVTPPRPQNPFSGPPYTKFNPSNCLLALT